MDWPVEFTHSGIETITRCSSSAQRGRPSQHAANKTQLPQYWMESLGSFASIEKKLHPHLDPAAQRTWGSYSAALLKKQINVAEKTPGRW